MAQESPAAVSASAPLTSCLMDSASSMTHPGSFTQNA